MPPPPTIGDEIAQPTANGGSLTLRPTASVIGYGYLCVVFEVAGTPPLAFAPDLLTLTVPSSDPWPVFSSDPTVSSGAAPTGVVFGDTEPTSREICLPEGGVDQFGGFLTYALDGASYQWALPPSP